MERNKPERISIRDSIRSIIDLGKVAAAGFIDKIDTRYANAINTPEIELPDEIYERYKPTYKVEAPVATEEELMQ